MSLSQTVATCVEIFRETGARAAIIGGLGLNVRGVGRMTRDVDWLLDRAQADAVQAALLATGFSILQRTGDVLCAYRSPDRIDCILAHRTHALRMLTNASRETLFDHHVSVVRSEDLIGLKVQAYANDPARRFGDQADILSLLKVPGIRLDLEEVAAYFTLFDKGADWEALRALV